MPQIKMTPEEFATKHATRLKASLPEMRTGIERVTEAPTAKAAAKADKMLAGITEAITSGKWARGLNRVTLEEWRDKTITKGLPRVATGIDAAHDKQVVFAGELFTHQNRGLTEIDRLPDMTLEDSIARATTWMRHMAGFRRS